jgi:hypothetical protein
VITTVGAIFRICSSVGPPGVSSRIRSGSKAITDSATGIRVPYAPPTWPTPSR